MYANLEHSGGFGGIIRGEVEGQCLRAVNTVQVQLVVGAKNQIVIDRVDYIAIKLRTRGVQLSVPIFGEDAGTGGDADVVIIGDCCGFSIQNQIPDLQEASHILAIYIIITVRIGHGQRVVNTQAIDIQCGRVVCIDHIITISINYIIVITILGINRYTVDLHGIAAVVQIIHPDNGNLVNSMDIVCNADIIVLQNSGNALYQLPIRIEHFQIDCAVIRI